MDARAYSTDDHAEVTGWFLARGLSPIPMAFLPRNGSIVPGVCAAFLYLTDSRVAFIDALVSNPEAGPAEVADGIGSTVGALTEIARSAGYGMLVFTAERPGVIGLGHRLGFRHIADYGAMMAKEI